MVFSETLGRGEVPGTPEGLSAQGVVPVRGEELAREPSDTRPPKPEPPPLPEFDGLGLS